jgi:hypothetical protein
MTVGVQQQTQAIAVDIDPVMLAIGRGALGTVAGRLRWIEADLASPDWVDGLGETELDAVLTTMALHWLEPLRRVYHGFDVHVEALRGAGFREVETIWQVLSSRVLLAVR